MRQGVEKKENWSFPNIEGLRAEPRQSDYNCVFVLLPKSSKFMHPGHMDFICTKKSQFSNPKILKHLILQSCIPLARTLCIQLVPAINFFLKIF